MLLFMDGFSHYQLSDLLRKWTTKTDAWVTWSLPAEGRNGNCIKRVSTSNNGFSGFLNKGPDVNQAGPWTIGDRGICGFACKVDNLSHIAGGGAVLPPIGIGGDITNTLVTVIYGPWGAQLGVSLNTDGTFSLYRAGEANPLATSVSVAQNASWFYFEMKWIIHQTTGSCVVRVNNIEIINYSGPLLSNSKFSGGPLPAALWSSVNVLGLNSVPAPFLIVRMCDFYLSDWVTPNGNFLGDIVVSFIIPDAAGAQTVWTPTPAVPNWQNVNEVPPNDDTSFIQTLTIDNKDSYSFTPVTVNPLAIQHCICARRIVPGAAALQAITRQGGANNLATAQAIANETYKYNLFPFDTNPFTGIKWTQAEMNAAEFGVNKAT